MKRQVPRGGEREDRRRRGESEEAHTRRTALHAPGCIGGRMSIQAGGSRADKRCNRPDHGAKGNPSRGGGAKLRSSVREGTPTRAGRVAQPTRAGAGRSGVPAHERALRRPADRTDVSRLSLARRRLGLSDDERDADRDGLSNIVEDHFMTKSAWDGNLAPTTRARPTAATGRGPPASRWRGPVRTTSRSAGRRRSEAPGFRR